MDKDENGNPIIKEGEAEKGADNTNVAEADAFGEPNKPVEPPKKKGEEGGDKGKGGDDIEKNPLVVELRSQIETIKKEYGGNLSGQRDVIKRLETEIETLKKGGSPTGEGKDGGQDGEVLFKDIKWSKDLTQAEKDEMTDNEIKQMDVIASMQEAQNKMYSEMQRGKKSDMSENKAVEDLNTLVRTEAMELSKGEDGKENTELANQIIESFKAMKFSTDGLTEEDIKKRVAMSATQLSGYKPPKEQPNKKGAPVKKSGDSSDPFGVDKIIEEATTAQDGGYAL